MKPNSHLTAQSKSRSQIKAFCPASTAFQVTYPEYVLSCYPESPEYVHDTLLRTTPPQQRFRHASSIDMSLLLYHMSRRLGCLLSLFSWVLRIKDEKVIQVKTS